MVCPHDVSCFVVYTFIFLHREYVVDLVGKPGNVHGPDSSINGGLLSSVPSPFQISHLREYQQPYVDCSSSRQILSSEGMSTPCRTPLYSGMRHFAYLEKFVFLYIKV